MLHVDFMWAQAMKHNDQRVRDARKACEAYHREKSFAPSQAWVPLLYDVERPERKAPFYYCYERQHNKRMDTYGAIPALYPSRSEENTYTSYVTLHESRYNAHLSREDRGTIMSSIASGLHVQVATPHGVSLDLCRARAGEPSIAYPRVALIHGSTAQDVQVHVVQQVLDYDASSKVCTLVLLDGAKTRLTVHYGTLPSSLACTDVFERLLWEYNLTTRVEGPLLPPLQRLDGTDAEEEGLQIYGRVLDIQDAGDMWPVVSEPDQLQRTEGGEASAHMSPSNVHAMLCHNPTYLQYRTVGAGVCTVVDRLISTRFSYGTEGECQHAADPFEPAAKDTTRWKPCRLLVGSARKEPVCSASSMAAAEGYLAEALPVDLHAKRSKEPAMALHAQVGCFVLPYHSAVADVRCQERDSKDSKDAKRQRVQGSAAAAAAGST